MREYIVCEDIIVLFYLLDCYCQLQYKIDKLLAIDSKTGLASS